MASTKKLQPRGLWLLRFVIERENRLGPGCGYAVHLPLPSDAPPGLSMTTMRGLEKRGLVEEFYSGIFRATPQGRKVTDCRNCKWAKWQMTNHVPPRINTRVFGKCEFVVEMPVLPAVLVDDRKWQGSLNLNDFRARTIWAKSAYQNCPTWELKA